MEFFNIKTPYNIYIRGRGGWGAFNFMEDKKKIVRLEKNNINVDNST